MNMFNPDMPHVFTPNPDNTRKLRDAFGKFATGVTVVTCDSADGPVCIAANSFSSISLDPAFVMWAIDRNSSRFHYFSEAQHYAIHVMAADQSDLCQACAKDGKALQGVDASLNAEGVPLIAGCLARFECERVACHEAGDHVIVVGRVVRAEMREGEPLTFYAGKFGQFAQG